LFKARLELINELDQKLSETPREGIDKDAELRRETAYLLREEVASMNVDTRRPR